MARGNGWLFLHDYKRIEAPGFQPYPLAEATGRLLHALALTPAGEAPAPTPRSRPRAWTTSSPAARRCGRRSKHAEALPLFERATQLAPNSFDAWFNLGYVAQ